MKSADIREQFLQFFADKGHTRVPSSPLTPANDPTLLFTNSGMVQFKEVFLGFDKRPYRTATTAQRCLRAGGKHNDLENVGYTARHHTFFEMLGNFSFGDYFKERAIPLAWEFLTAQLNLDRQHLWVTVFGGGQLFGADAPAVPGDEDAFNIWKKTLMAAGFDEQQAIARITRIPTADNFWMMGETGPCGPCSEIFYDRDAAAQSFRGEDEATADDCVEVWNLVFMEFNRDDTGELRKLPAPCVDTGMGLERISAVMQGVKSNYDIDLFKDLLTAVAAEVVAAGGESSAHHDTPSHRVIADHIRAAAFLLADGVMPSNEGRGYVLRRIIRRALRHGHKLGARQAFFYRLAATLPPLFGKAHPVIVPRLPLIEKTLRAEEESFSTMLQHGMNILRREIDHLGGQKELPGAVVFKLYDTYGFPADMTADILREENLTADMAGFDACMAQQRARSRAAMTFNIGAKTAEFDGAATEFLGYDEAASEAKILALFVGGETIKEARPGDETLIILDRTPFYAEAGGQVGDTGTLSYVGGQAAVADTQKIRADVWGHFAVVNDAPLTVGDTVYCAIDQERRAAIRCNHSATHLMHAALRQVLGDHVEQKGSLVSPQHLRFDFSQQTAVSEEELRRAENIVNAQVRHNAEVQTEWLPYDDALARGAMALFGEKYGDMVRVITIGADFSVELCGGTHVQRAGDIGFFQFVGESAIAAGVRRVEAVTAAGAVARVQELDGRLRGLSDLLKAPAAQLEEKIIQLRETLKETQRRLDDMQAAQASAQAGQLAAQAETRGDAKVLVTRVAGADIKILRELAAQLRGNLGAAAILLAGDGGGRAAFVAAITSELAAVISAREWLEVVAAAAGAKGGGKPDFAQAGGGDAAQIEDALTAARTFLAGKI